MLHVAIGGLLILAAWLACSLAVVLILGPWLRRAGEMPTGPTTHHARAVLRSTGRLVILPYIIERTAHGQRRQQRDRRASSSPMRHLTVVRSDDETETKTKTRATH